MPDALSETKRLFAKRHTGRASEADSVAWAIGLLEAGYETKSLGILASLNKPYYYSEVEDYFRRSLEELNWATPGREESLRWYARDVAAKVLSGDLSASEGCKELHDLWIALDYPGDMAVWAYLYDGVDVSSNRELSTAELETEVVSEARSLIEMIDA